VTLTLPESLPASDGMQKDASTFDERLSLAPSRPTRQSISTMAVHDSVTGKIRRHAVRKVAFCVLYVLHKYLSGD